MIERIVNRFNLWDNAVLGKVAKIQGQTFEFGVAGRAHVPLGFWENGYYIGIRYIAYWTENRVAAKKLLNNAYKETMLYQVDCCLARWLYLSILRIMNNQFFYMEESLTGKPHMNMLMRFFFDD
jgi:hypothetical protein